MTEKEELFAEQKKLMGLLFASIITNYNLTDKRLFIEEDLVTNEYICEVFLKETAEEIIKLNKKVNEYMTNHSLA